MIQSQSLDLRCFIRSDREQWPWSAGALQQRWFYYMCLNEKFETVDQSKLWWTHQLSIWWSHSWWWPNMNKWLIFLNTYINGSKLDKLYHVLKFKWHFKNNRIHLFLSYSYKSNTTMPTEFMSDYLRSLGAPLHMWQKGHIKPSAPDVAAQNLINCLKCCHLS